MSSTGYSRGRTSPRHVIIMGVTASGKSTVAARLARRLGWSFGEGDAFHPESNVEKMASGVPLIDDDRAPWLDAIAGWLSSEDAVGHSTVVACSALKRRYRDRLRAAASDVRFAHLDVQPGVLEQRLRARRHFMPAELLESQLRDLEPLENDEPGITLDADRPPGELVDELAALLAAA